MSKTFTVGSKVKQIQSYKTEEEAVRKFVTDGVTFSGFSERWVRSVFRNRVTLPVLDLSVDVHGEGVNVLNHMGISEEVQSTMWQKWALTPDDVKAAWISDWQLLDTSDTQDVFSYVELMVKFLTL